MISGATNDMEPGSRPWQELIIDGAAQLGVTVTADHVRQFALYAGELLRWNARANLTRIVAPKDVAIKHFVDSLAAAVLIDPGKSVVDIGAGAGFPGLVLKIVRPSLALTLIDAVAKKVNFQRQAIRLLGLEGIQALHVRAEDLARQRPAAFDVAVCRALTDLAQFWRLAAPLLNASGMAIAYKGSVTEAELAALKTGAGQVPPRVDISAYRLPLDGSQRALVVLHRF